MINLRRITVSGAAGLALVAPALISGPAHAGYDARVTIHVSDTTVHSGQQFRVHGKYLFGDNTPVVGKRIRVQSKSPKGKWTKIKGATLRTNAEGHYRIRVILSRKGNRMLRVKAQGPDSQTAPLRSKAIKVRVR